MFDQLESEGRSFTSEPRQPPARVVKLPRSMVEVTDFKASFYTFFLGRPYETDGGQKNYSRTIQYPRYSPPE